VSRLSITQVPYGLTRLGVIMTPDRQNPFEAEGVLNPASGRDAAGKLWLLPRVVARGNVSRVGLAEVLIENGVPVGVRREGIVLSPDTGWEKAHDHAGVEDPRITWVPSLALHVMTYVAFGPLGPRPALATSTDLRTWVRLGPVQFQYLPELDTDLNLFPNKDVVYFSEPVPGPGGRPCYAALHRPMWDLGWLLGGTQTYLPGGVTDDRPGIWISYVPVEDVRRDVRALVRLGQHRLVAMPEYAFESLKIGAGPPPLRVAEGWLLIHHGVSGALVAGWAPQQDVSYAAGAMLLDAHDPSRVLGRSTEPLLAPEAAEETNGIVPNVVFPTAIADIRGTRYVFYGMADSAIGVARLDELGTVR
jgi:beta-1,2-mannobiose phosphorylase / 1,2-beta-oligomannan phosphorylase